MSSILGEWREGKVRPILGNAPRNRLVSRECPMLWSICDDPFPPLDSRSLTDPTGRPVGVFSGMAESIWSDGGFKTKTLARDHTASRWSAPSQSQRTRREDHALSHRPQMSSGRLFLDRVARQHCPSPLHRQAQTNTRFPTALEKRTFLLCQEGGHFYFALTARPGGLPTVLRSDTLPHHG